MSSNLILILISAVPVCLMWTATGRIPAARLVPINVKSRRSRIH
jgi:hypothetical protein